MAATAQQPRRPQPPQSYDNSCDGHHGHNGYDGYNGRNTNSGSTATTTQVVITASIDCQSLTVRWSALYSHDDYNSHNICNRHDTHYNCNSWDSYSRHNGHNGYGGFDDHKSNNYFLNHLLHGPKRPKRGSAKARLQYSKVPMDHVFSGHRFCGCQRNNGLHGEGTTW